MSAAIRNVLSDKRRETGLVLQWRIPGHFPKTPFRGHYRMMDDSDTMGSDSELQSSVPSRVRCFAQCLNRSLRST